MLLLLVFPGYTAVAAGQREDPVAAARAMVDEGQINEAIMLLQDTMRRNPNRIDDAERLMRRIRDIRSRYNDLLDRLLAHLADNPEDMATTLAMIDELEALDRQPNERIARQIGLARVVAQLAFDRSVAAEIMAEAAVLLESERYTEALERYLSGFALQREAFEARDYPAMIEASVDRAIDQVRRQSQAFQQRLNELTAGYRDLLEAIETRHFDAIEDSLEAFGTFLAASVENELQTDSAGETISGHRSTVPALFPEDPVDWHMVFLEQFILGRPRIEQREGILGAMRLVRERQQQRLSSAFESARGEIERLARSDYDARRWSEALEHYRDMQELSRLGVTMAAAGSRHSPEVDELDAALEELSEVSLSVYLLHHAAYRASESLAQYSVGMETADEALGIDIELLTALNERRALLAEAATVLDDQLLQWNTTVERYPVDAALFPDNAADIISRTEQQLEDSRREVQTAEIETVRRIGEWRYSRLPEDYLRSRQTYQSAVQRIEGIEAEIDEAGEGEDAVVVLRYPREALSDLEITQDEAESMRQETESLIVELESEDYLSEDPIVSRMLSDARGLLSRIDDLQQDVISAVDTAQQQIATAERLRARGNQLASQTEQALAGLDVNRARDLWEQTREAYFESLEMQQDEAFREQADARIAALGVRLQEAENELIVQRVRELIDRADTLYRQEDYRLARSVLNEARETWSRTNVDENPEIERLDRFVTAALTMEARRTLVATEPLYPVLSNYLNLAQIDYDRAQDLIRSRSLDAAQPLLSRAEQNLQNVTAVRPYNWEARLLRLEILRIVEADDFATLFENRVEEAWAVRNEDPAATLVDLQALRAIDPDYPGLSSRIEQLEIRLGIRPDPVDQAQIARSNQLLQQARNLAAGAGTAQVRAAISLLEEAVTLNPDNTQAKVLLDTLRIRTGGQAAVALSSADEQQFRRAETLFVEGNVAQAFAIVERLLQEEDNRLYPPLLNLRQRIANRLGI